jgi:dihydroorotase
MQNISIPLPFEGHVHFRQGDLLKAVVPYTAMHFWAGVAMPNTIPPITTCDQAVTYAEEIEKAAAPVNENFKPLVGLFLTDNLDPAEIVRAMTKSVTRNSQPRRLAEFVKFYPLGATTNSSHGVKNILKCDRVLHAMEKYGMPLCLHGEVNFKENEVSDHAEREVYDHLERERIFVTDILPQLQKLYPRLKIILEHISTKEAARAVSKGLPTLAATVTPQHLMLTHADLFEGGLRPHLFCYPILKHRSDVAAVRNLVFSGHPRVFAGSDSAPHLTSKKHSACCPGGVFSAPGLLERYATIWSSHKKLSTETDAILFSNFMSRNGPRFYGFLPHSKMITLTKNQWSLEGKQFADHFPKDLWNHMTEQVLPFCHKEIENIPFEWRVQ